MRFMKKLLVTIYLYIGVFGVICLVMWIATREEPTSLIAGVFGAAGVESLISGILRMSENKAERAERKREEEAALAEQEKQNENIIELE